MAKKRKKRVKIILYILVVFLFQEVVIRYCYPLPELSNFDRINYMVLNPQGKKYFHFRNSNWYWHSTLDTVAQFEHRLNMYGFRDKEWSIEKMPGTKRVFFIGDSFVEGIMAKQNETIPTAFSQASGEDNYEVFNCGIAGVGLDAYVQFMADAIPVYKPDIVFLCIYANDLSPKSAPRQPVDKELINYPMMRPRFLEVHKQSKTNGDLRALWSDETSKPFFQPCPDNGNPWTNREDELKQLIDREMAQTIIDGNLSPYRAGGFLHEIENLNQPPALGTMLPYLKEICRNNGAEPIVVYIPSRNQVTDYYHPYEQALSNIHDSLTPDLTSEAYQLHQRVLSYQCQDFGIHFIDLTGVVKENETRGNRLYWNYDEHMRGKGYQLLGKNIWQQWNARK